jgi:Protein of unknown function (DUF1579)
MEHGMPTKPKVQLPKPGAEHRLLKVFVGKWHAEGASYADGQQADDPLASAVPWVSDESYEWLPGDFFVLHRWDAMAGARAFKGMEVIGYDTNQGAYFTRLFDNAGNHPEYIGELKGHVWNFSEMLTRATISVSADGNNMHFNWEWRKLGSAWLPLCDRMAVRVGE